MGKGPDRLVFCCGDCGSGEWTINGVGDPYCEGCGADLDGEFEMRSANSPHWERRSADYNSGPEGSVDE